MERLRELLKELDDPFMQDYCKWLSWQIDEPERKINKGDGLEHGS